MRNTIPNANGIGKSKQAKQPRQMLFLPKAVTQATVNASGGTSTRMKGSRIIMKRAQQILFMALQKHPLAVEEFSN